MTCPLGAATVKDCLKVRRVEFRRQRATWEPFPCESCKDGIANEEAVAEIEGDRTGNDVVPQHNRQDVAQVSHCVDCGKQVSRDSVRCRVCHDRNRNLSI